MQPEARIGKQIREYLAAQGAFTFKVHGGALMTAGLPDLIVCYKGKFIGIEVKVPGKNATPRQLFVHQQIRKAGGIAFVARCVEDVQKEFRLLNRRIKRETSS